MSVRVLLDMDGCLVDLLPEWLRAYRDAGGEHLTPSDIPEYNWENYVKDRPLFLKLLKSAGIFASARPMPDAIEGLQLLRAAHEVTLVTTVYGTRATDAKIGWLFRYVRPAIRTEDVIFCRRKELIDGDVLIEDSPINMERWLTAHPYGWGYLVSQPYNLKFKHPRCIRVGSLLDVVRLLPRFGAAA